MQTGSPVFKRAQGDIIAFLDADDEYYYDTTLSTLYQPFPDKPGINAAFGFPQGIDHDSNPIGFPPQLEKLPDNTFRLANHVAFSWKYLCAKFLPCYLSAIMFKRECLNEVALGVSQLRQQREVATKTVKGQVTIVPVITVEKGPFLVAMQRVVSGIKIQDDLPGLSGNRFTPSSINKASISSAWR